MSERQEKSTALITAYMLELAFCGGFLVTVVFVLMKAVHALAWTWLWVLSPLWMAALLFVGIVVFVTVYIGVQIRIETIQSRRAPKRKVP